MVNEINIICSASQIHQGTPYPQFLGNLLTVVWASLFSISSVIARRAVKKDPFDFRLWHVVWFSFIIALVCWVLSQQAFMDPALVNRPAPVVGMITALALNTGLMIALKQAGGVYTFSPVFVVPFALMAVSFALLSPSLEIVTLPRDVLLCQIGVFLFFLLGCLLSSFIFSALTVRYPFFNPKGTANKEGDKD